MILNTHYKSDKSTLAIKDSTKIAVFKIIRKFCLPLPASLVFKALLRVLLSDFRSPYR